MNTFKNNYSKDLLLNIPKWLEKGYKLFPESQWSNWYEFVSKNLENPRMIKELLEIQEILFSEAEDKFQQVYDFMKDSGHTGYSYSFTLGLIERFCSHGEAYCEWSAQKESQYNAPTMF